MRLIFILVIGLGCCSCQLSKRGIQIEPSKVPELAFLDTVGRSVEQSQNLICVASGISSSEGNVNCELEFCAVDDFDIPGARRQMLRVTDNICQAFISDPMDCLLILRKKEGLTQLRQKLEVTIHCVNRNGHIVVPPAIACMVLKDDKISYVIMNKKTKEGVIIHVEDYSTAQKHAAGEILPKKPLGKVML